MLATPWGCSGVEGQIEQTYDCTIPCFTKSGAESAKFAKSMLEGSQVIKIERV